MNWECENCGTIRVIKDGTVEKCPNCGDDEFDPMDYWDIADYIPSSKE